MIGCGAVGQGLLPLLLKSNFIRAEQLTIITADDAGRAVATQYGVTYQVEPISPDNLASLLELHLDAGDLLLNLSVGVSSLALIEWCKSHEVMYLDTCVEPWQGGYIARHDNDLHTSNGWLREQALALHTPGAATAVIAHGMNPGLISHLLKAALRELAQLLCISVSDTPDWAALAQNLGVKVVHLVERDTQDDGQPLGLGSFANTWSAHGLYSEACLQHAELAWGTHEKKFPVGASVFPFSRALRLSQPGAEISLQSWSPSQGKTQGLLITHHEVHSIAALLNSGNYQPSVAYVYTPCPKACESLAQLRAGNSVTDFRVLDHRLLQGEDEIGVLLIHDRGALWHGCTLSSDEARQLMPHNSATSLQVVAGIMGALMWMLDHPRAGVVEAESMDSAQILAIARPYLGTISTAVTDSHADAALDYATFLLPEPAVPAHSSATVGYIRHANSGECADEAIS